MEFSVLIAAVAMGVAALGSVSQWVVLRRRRKAMQATTKQLAQESIELREAVRRLAALDHSKDVSAQHLLRVVYGASSECAPTLRRGSVARYRLSELGLPVVVRSSMLASASEVFYASVRDGLLEHAARTAPRDPLAWSPPVWPRPTSTVDCRKGGVVDRPQSFAEVLLTAAG